MLVKKLILVFFLFLSLLNAQHGSAMIVSVSKGPEISVQEQNLRLFLGLILVFRHLYFLNTNEDVHMSDYEITIESFQRDLLDAGHRLVDADSLSWYHPRLVFPEEEDDFGETSYVDTRSLISGYSNWQMNRLPWYEIRSGICWELFGILLLHSGYSRDRVFHDQMIKTFAKTYKSAPQLPDVGNTAFETGEVILLNGGDHVVVATGRGDEVFSLWNRPQNGLVVISLRKLVQLCSVDLPIFSYQIMKVESIFNFLEQLKRSSQFFLSFLSIYTCSPEMYEEY